MGCDIIPFGFYPTIGAMGIPLCTKIIILKLFSIIQILWSHFSWQVIIIIIY
jgi:hypothetical protein